MTDNQKQQEDNFFKRIREEQNRNINDLDMSFSDIRDSMKPRK